MGNMLAFNVPFNGFCGTTFINCFTSVYMFLEGINPGKSDYLCRQLEGKSCNSCGNCGKGGSTPISVQEKYFFLFDTICGHSSLRCRYDDTPTEMHRMICETDYYDGGTENNIDFLFGFAGRNYNRLTDMAGFTEAIKSSIDAGRPVIAKTRTGENRFRVITGYDEKSLISPDYTNAQKKPEGAPDINEIDSLYIPGDKTTPRYTIIDGFKRIRQVMEYNARENLWGGYTDRLALHTPNGMRNISLDEKKARMKRVAETMWHTFNCHNFAEVFRKYRNLGEAGGNNYDNVSIYDSINDIHKLRNPEFKKHWDRISGPCYGYTHDLAWALIGLEKCADWTKHAAGYFGEMVELTLSQIAKNDAEVLSIITEVIKTL